MTISATPPRIGRKALVLLGVTVAALALGVARIGWDNLWASPDQRGRYLFERGRYAEAAESFRDPVWRGAALMRAGDFKTAAQVFGSRDSAESAYDQGNALVMLGQYEAAVGRYDRALELKPGWDDAMANRKLAQLRADLMKAPGGDLGDQQEGADQIVYDKDAKNPDGQDTEVSGQPMSDEEVRALWLKRVQTRPADFLRARFAYQLQAAPPPAAEAQP
jgi:Ca-activated chloride channel family protein